MNCLIVLLRAINVGGKNKVPMAELRELLSDLDFTDVATYIQSGNVVCSSPQSPADAAASIKQGIRDRFELDIEVMARTAEEFAAIVDLFPYLDADPKSSGVVFLSQEVGGDSEAAENSEAGVELDASRFAPDECKASGSEVFVNCPTRFAETKLTAAWIEKETGRAGTRRNWATVLRLQSMAAACAAGRSG